MKAYKALSIAAAVAALFMYHADASAQRAGPTDPVLSVSVAGSIAGTIIGQGTGINCPTNPTSRSRCSVNVLAGATVTLTAVPSPGAYFGAWQVGSVCAGQGETCSFVMPTHPEGTVVSFATSIVCNGQPLICPSPGGCVCNPQLCSVTISYAYDYPTSTQVSTSAGCSRQNDAIALDAAADSFVP